MSTRCERRLKREREETYNSGEERTRDPLVEDVIPVGVLEEQVLFDFNSVGFSRSQSSDWIPREQLRSEKAVSKRARFEESRERTFCRMLTLSFGMWIG